MTTTGEDYVNSVLHFLPRTTPKRAQIAMELRGHIAERVADGLSLDDVLRQLGDPATLADSYLSAEPLVSAPFGTRAAAKIVDVLCVMAVLVPVVWVAAGLAPAELFVPILMFGVLFGSSILFGIYTVVAESTYGQTAGKRLLGLRVVGESGARIGIGQSVVRQLPMFLQVYWIDVFFALFTEKHQRAFEMLSKTRVVRALGQEVI